MEKFSIICKGRILPGRSESQVVAKLSILFKQSPENMQKLISRRGVIKRDLPSGSAKKYVKGLESAGLDVEARLHTDHSLYSQSLVISQAAALKIEPAILCYEIPLKRLAATLAANPCTEKLQSVHSPAYLVQSHRWWVSPTFAALAALLATPLVQQYLLQLGAKLTTGMGITVVGIVGLLLLMLFLPPLFSIQRLVSVRQTGDHPRSLVMNEVFSKNPLQKQYVLYEEDNVFFVKAGRYQKDKVMLFDGDGELLYSLEKDIDGDDLLGGVAEELRENIAALGLIDRVIHLVMSVFKPHVINDVNKTKSSPEYMLAICDSMGDSVGMVYKGGVGVIELNSQRLLPDERAKLLLLGLIGLGMK